MNKIKINFRIKKKTNYGFLTVDGPEQNDQSELSYLVQQRQIIMIIVKTEKKRSEMIIIVVVAIIMIVKTVKK